MEDVARSLQLMKDAAFRAGKRREKVDDQMLGVPVTVFLYSKVEAAALCEALDRVELTDQQAVLRDELQGFVVA